MLLLLLITYYQFNRCLSVPFCFEFPERNFPALRSSLPFGSSRGALLARGEGLGEGLGRGVEGREGRLMAAGAPKGSKRSSKEHQREVSQEEFLKSF